MQNGWILDVLADLRAFARQNDLPALAEQLDDTRVIAAAELASIAEGTVVNEHGAAEAVGDDHSIVGRRC